MSDSIFATDETVPDSTLYKIIEQTQSKRIEPVLKPHIDLMNGIPRYQMQPKDINKWVDLYVDLYLTLVL